MGDEGRSQEVQGAGESEEDGLFTVSPSYGGNPLPYPQEGEIGSGATPTFEPWEDTGWEADEGTIGISNNRRTATALLEMNCVAVTGESTFSSGRHAWTVIIEVSRLNYGGAICIGVTDANPSQERQDSGGGWSCGFNPYCGAFFVTADAYKVDYSTPGHSLMNGDLQGKANKAAVTVMVDMDQRQLAFSINRGPSVLGTKAGGLPSTVRPWVHLFKEHDSVTITAPQCPSNAVVPGPQTPGEYVSGEDSFHHDRNVGRGEDRKKKKKDTHAAPQSPQLPPRTTSSGYMSGVASALPALPGASSNGRPYHDPLEQASGAGSVSSRSSHCSSSSSSTPGRGLGAMLGPNPGAMLGGARSRPHAFGGSREPDRGVVPDRESR